MARTSGCKRNCYEEFIPTAKYRRSQMAPNVTSTDQAISGCDDISHLGGKSSFGPSDAKIFSREPLPTSAGLKSRAFSLTQDSGSSSKPISLWASRTSMDDLMPSGRHGTKDSCKDLDSADILIYNEVAQTTLCPIPRVCETGVVKCYQTATGKVASSGDQDVSNDEYQPSYRKQLEDKYTQSQSSLLKPNDDVADLLIDASASVAGSLRGSYEETGGETPIEDDGEIEGMSDQLGCFNNYPSSDPTADAFLEQLEFTRSSDLDDNSNRHHIIGAGAGACPVTTAFDPDLQRKDASFDLSDHEAAELLSAIEHDEQRISDRELCGSHERNSIEASSYTVVPKALENESSFSVDKRELGTMGFPDGMSQTSLSKQSIDRSSLHITAQPEPLDQHPRRPIVRRPFMRPIRKRSQIFGTTDNFLLRTCFRIGEVIQIANRAPYTLSKITIELFARVTAITHGGGPSRNHEFLFRDLYHDKPPHLVGALKVPPFRGVQGGVDAVIVSLKEENAVCRVIANVFEGDARRKLEIFSMSNVTRSHVEHVARIYSNHPM